MAIGAAVALGFAPSRPASHPGPPHGVPVEIRMWSGPEIHGKARLITTFLDAYGDPIRGCKISPWARKLTDGVRCPAHGFPFAGITPLVPAPGKVRLTIGAPPS